MKGFEDEQMKKKKNVVDWFVFLPDDVLLDVLKRLPDVFLRYKATYVCKRWFDIITNRILLDHVSFIIRKSIGTVKARCVDIREEGQGLQIQGSIQGCSLVYGPTNPMSYSTHGRDIISPVSLKWKKIKVPSCTNYGGELVSVQVQGRKKSLFSYDLKDGVLKELNIHIGFGDGYVAHSSTPSFMEWGSTDDGSMSILATFDFDTKFSSIRP
ncbi:hypothetical protein L1887_09085 [Cichorium endivia]|nr:hypothetical protein L1887_09085 [Cichorium endivia]